MQLGITLLGQDLYPVEQLVELAQLAERNGFHSLWMPEIWGRDAFTQLAYIAARTERITLGTAIVPIYSRSAALLAMSACSLDQLSNGRFILGLGNSGRIVVEDLHGVPFGKPLTAMREVAQVVRRFLDGERVNHTGPRLTLRNFALGERPRQQRLPIYIGAQGEKNIALAAEIADGWIGYLLPRGGLAEAVRQLHAVAKASGRNEPAPVAASMILGCLGADAEITRGLAQNVLAYYIGGMGAYHFRAVHQRGFAAECEAIRAAWEAKDRKGAARLVTDAMLDELAIWGDAQTAWASLERYVDAGLDLPILSFPHGATFEMMCATIEELAPAAYTGPRS